MQHLDGKVAVITGGASGIGYGMAQRFKAAGLQVMIADIEQTALDKAAHTLDVATWRTDVSDAKSVAALAQAAVETFGTVHVLCNNAGVGSAGEIAGLTLADWHWMLNVNLYGVIHGLHHFLPILKANVEGGHVVSTASLAGLFTAPTMGAYCASKFAVVAIMEALALELEAAGSQVRSSIMIPGPVRTNISASLRNRPQKGDGSGLADFNLDDIDAYAGHVPWKSPEDIGDLVLEGILHDDLYIMTHPREMGMIHERHRRIEAARERAARRHAAA